MTVSIRTRSCFLAACLLATQFTPSIGWTAEDASAVESRIFESVKYLASDELEGRGIGTKGLDAAASYIADTFSKLGLKTSLYDGTAYQRFKMTTSTKLGSPNSLALVGPLAAGDPAQKIEVKLGEEFNPLALGGSGKFDLPLVFVGYGITAKNEKYDDYAGIDVKDKVVVVMRHEPEQSNPHSAFDGTKNSEYAPYTRKISNAYEHGAAAIIFCNDDFDVRKNIAALRKRWQEAVEKLAAEGAAFKAQPDPKPEAWQETQQKIDKLADEIKTLSGQLQGAGDPLLGFDAAGGEGEGRNFPVIFCRRAPLDKVVQAALGKSLAELEKEIDKGPTPHSAVLTGWKAIGQTTVERQEADVQNVIAVLEGEGPLAEETIIIGAHYDHLGLGGESSLAKGVKEIHNGADDNGSGSAVLLEVARELAGSGKKLPRRIVFIAFTGEEKGLIGSARYVRNPLFPLEKTVAMLNMDMVGRLQDEKLIVHGTGTAPELDALVDRFGKEQAFTIIKKPGGFGPSDHSSFYAAKIPVLHFFTGNHADYHKPSDDYDKLVLGGMRRVGQMVTDMAVALAEAPARPTYTETAPERPAAGSGDRPYFGSIPDFSQDQPGYALTGVTKSGPAEKAGLKAGDIIIQLGESKIGNLEDFDSALRKFKAGDKAMVVAKRGKDEVKLEVILEAPK